MTPREELIEALRVLCANNGGHVAVADKIGVNDQHLWQILNDIRLPSGNPRGVGPSTQKKLEAKYPGWSKLRPDVDARGSAPSLATPESVIEALGAMLRAQPKKKRGKLAGLLASFAVAPEDASIAEEIAVFLKPPKVIHPGKAA